MMPIQNNDNDQINYIKRVSAKMSENFPNDNHLLNNNPIDDNDIDADDDDDDDNNDNDDDDCLDVRKFYNKLKNSNDCLIDDEFNLDYDDHMYTTNNTTIHSDDNSELTALISDNCTNQTTPTTTTTVAGIAAGLASATAATTTTTTESEVKFWKEWLILHLDLIQQQSDEILDKERTILILQQENEMLKERISCMERGAPFQPNKFLNNHTTPATTTTTTTTTTTYLDQNLVEDSITQDSSVCDEDTKNCIDLLDLNCENGQSDLKLLNFDTPPTTTTTTETTALFETKQILSDIESQIETNNINNQTIISDSVDGDQLEQQTIVEEKIDVTKQIEEIKPLVDEDEEDEEDEIDDVDADEIDDVDELKTNYDLDNFSDNNRNMKKLEGDKFHLNNNNNNNHNNNSNNSEKFDFTIDHIKDFDSVRNLRMSIRRKRLSNSSALSNNEYGDEKRSFRRLRKKRKKMMKDSQILTTTEQYVSQASDTNLYGISKLSDTPIDIITHDTTLEVPRWRVKVYASCYSMEGTENLDDEVFNKRHSRLENDERRRKRWDVQRIREQRVIEKLKQRQERSSSGSKVEDPIDCVQSLWPKLDDIKQLEIAENLPVAAFGCPIPKLTSSEFNLPWLSNPNLLITRRPSHSKRLTTTTTTTTASTTATAATRRRRR